MRVLADVKPTAEQLPILYDYQPGFVLIRGAAGSGKTTTAVLRLRHVTGARVSERSRKGIEAPVRVLVLTYNKTLRGYVKELVEEKMDLDQVHLKISTFGKWAGEVQDKPRVLSPARRSRELWKLGNGIGYERDFLLDEIDYVLGRYLPEQIDQYYADPKHPYFERRGRGPAPRVSRKRRERIVDEVIEPYKAWKEEEGLLDWADVDLGMVQREPSPEERWDVVVVDEAQDFSANQIRGLTNHLARSHSTTFVLDAIQRVYPRGFGWPEVKVKVENSQTYHLRRNHRNTRQIAAFALPLVRDLPKEDDGTLPDFKRCAEKGEVPFVVRGSFTAQMDWVIRSIEEKPSDESVALLHAKGGGWFDFVRERLSAAKIPFVELQGRAEWPTGEEQVGLSTLHSAKGLEFDHVYILGLAAEQMPHGSEENDTQLNNHRRLVAMAIGRARKSVALTYKPGEESQVVHLLDAKTYREVDL
ncbi:MAG TPA: 3'-5' exonuclease [Solirubrobacterales bacterium]|jgi:superfamily I DNA/RNA helicase|nr:3'-5' exonuclease [Solirubrobacterales bacterium]